MKNYSILLIDDDQINNHLNKHLLLKLGIASEIHIAENGLNGLSRLKAMQAPPDFVFLDIEMPVMNAFEFLSHYSMLDIQYTRNTKIILLSAVLHPDLGERISGFPIHHILTKPLTDQKIAEVLEAHYMI